MTKETQLLEGDPKLVPVSATIRGDDGCRQEVSGPKDLIPMAWPVLATYATSEQRN